jgi:phage shock protein A
MRFLDRMTTLIKADAHGALESIEDRRLLAKQLVRDARNALDAKQTRLGELRAEEQRLVQEHKRLTAVMDRVEADVRLAMQEPDDALARGAIRKLLPLREAGRRLDERLATVREETTLLAERLAVQESELEVLRTRLSAELALAVDLGSSDDSFDRAVITEDDVELELLRRRGARTAAEGSRS